jgi:RNA polymerase sigma-70 factor (ECF subfamily)
MPKISFKVLVNDYSKAVLNTATRILRDSQKAQDVHQEVFLEILRRWHKYNGVTNWGAYLYRATVRKALEFAEQAKKDPPFENRKYPKTQESPDEPMRTAELQERLVASLTKLPKRQADVFVFARVEGLGYEKIAELMDCSQETVRVHLHRALKRLARELRDYIR